MGGKKGVGVVKFVPPKTPLVNFHSTKNCPRHYHFGYSKPF